MRQPRSSLLKSARGGGVRLKTVAQAALLLAMLSYAVVGWRAWSRSGGTALESASRAGCFGPPVGFAFLRVDTVPIPSR